MSRFTPENLISEEGPYEGETVGVSYKNIEHVTEKAALLLIDDDVKIWVPKKLIREADDETIILAEWFATENDLKSW